MDSDTIDVTFGFHDRHDRHPEGSYSGSCAGTGGLKNPLNDGTDEVQSHSNTNFNHSGHSITYSLGSEEGFNSLRVSEYFVRKGEIEITLFDALGNPVDNSWKLQTEGTTVSDNLGSFTWTRSADESPVASIRVSTTLSATPSDDQTMAGLNAGAFVVVQGTKEERPKTLNLSVDKDTICVGDTVTITATIDPPQEESVLVRLSPIGSTEGNISISAGDTEGSIQTKSDAMSSPDRHTFTGQWDGEDVQGEVEVLAIKAEIVTNPIELCQGETLTVKGRILPTSEDRTGEWELAEGLANTVIEFKEKTDKEICIQFKDYPSSEAPIPENFTEFTLIFRDSELEDCEVEKDGRITPFNRSDEVSVLNGEGASLEPLSVTVDYQQAITDSDDVEDEEDKLGLRYTDSYEDSCIGRAKPRVRITVEYTYSVSTADATAFKERYAHAATGIRYTWGEQTKKTGKVAGVSSSPNISLPIIGLNLDLTGDSENQAGTERFQIEVEPLVYETHNPTELLELSRFVQMQGEVLASSDQGAFARASLSNARIYIKDENDVSVEWKPQVIKSCN
ncbi:MAG: hypothetical protein LAT55_10525 [Opitutales bacterium]|nr:hypothetical protein [Opitutales bacterium]